jgi:hypothetical protein
MPMEMPLNADISSRRRTPTTPLLCVAQSNLTSTVHVGDTVQILSEILGSSCLCIVIAERATRSLAQRHDV